MRRRITVLTLFLALLSAGLHAQSGTFAALYGKYSSLSGVRSMAVDKAMLTVIRMASSEIPEGMTGMKTLAIDDRSKVPEGTAENLEREVMAVVSDTSSYYKLPDFARKGYDIRAYARKPAQKEKYRDIIVYLGGEKTAVIELQGEFGMEIEFIRKLISGE